MRENRLKAQLETTHFSYGAITKYKTENVQYV